MAYGFLGSIGGIGVAGMQLRPFKNETGAVENEILLPKVVGRLHLAKTIFGEDFTFLKSIANVTPKLTIPSPSMLHGLGAGGSKGTASIGMRSSS